MKSLFNESEYTEIRNRVQQLTPQSTGLWGKMSVAQMLAHCAIGFEKATGKLPFEDKSNFIMRTLVKRMVLKAVKKGDLGKNQKTFADFEVKVQMDFFTQKQRLLDALDAFYQLKNSDVIGRHPYFGKFTHEDWGALQYLHTHHHLVQFAV